MDAEVGPSGKFTIPAKKRDLYGFEPGEYVTGIVDKVVMR
jgi:bifunctional DNA-binding transcriptional regulator/antitoxin component of YhaV-PrlF toxin-antitoxin module